jgi:16S rRNA (uracil1498-N3)-methyltransferase
MSIPHFFIEQRIDGKANELVALNLPADVCNHMRTLRLRARERVVLVDAPGHGWEFELDASPERAARVIEGVLVREHLEEHRPQLTLVQGISTADRMDQTIRQTSELGVSRIIPLESERSTVRLDSATRAAKHERWQRIARGAAEQSGQLWLPTIEEPVDPRGALEALANYDALLFCWEEPGGRSVRAALRGVASRAKSGGRGSRDGAKEQTQTLGDSQKPHGPHVAVIVGPEGGFSVEEAVLFASAGAKTVTLGTTILRTETAAVVTCALALYELGALGAAAVKAVSSAKTASVAKTVGTVEAAKKPHEHASRGVVSAR